MAVSWHYSQLATQAALSSAAAARASHANTPGTSAAQAPSLHSEKQETSGQLSVTQPAPSLISPSQPIADLEG